MRNSVTALFADRLQDLIAESGKTISELSSPDEIGISSGSLSKYQNDAAEPGITALVKIADYFAVSFDYLLGKSNCKKEEYSNISERTGISEKAVNYLCNMDTVVFSNGITATSKYEYLRPSTIISSILESELFEEFMTDISCSIFQVNKKVTPREYTSEDYDAIHSLYEAGDILISTEELAEFKLANAQKKMDRILENIALVKKDLV